MSTETHHPAIAFASRYGGETEHYLTAYTAIGRMQTLLDDLRALTDMADQRPQEGSSWLPWYGLEAYSYYAVGYVTCLEWHARARLVDLLVYDPATLRIDDVRGAISDKLIVQMVAQQSSVAQLVAASLRIGSVERYFSIFGRIFDSASVPCSLRDWVTGNADVSTTCWLREDDLAQLQYLFDFRHGLVHEIGHETAGHWNMRSSWDARAAKFTGHAVMQLMTAVEAALTQYAPSKFPNLLDREGYPVSAAARYRGEMERLERLAEEQKHSWTWQNADAIAAWEDAREKFAAYMKADLKLIDKVKPAYWRYLDVTTPLQTRLFKFRHDFLVELLSHSDPSGSHPDEKGEILTVDVDHKAPHS